MWWAVWIVSFRPEIGLFYRPEWTKGGTTWKWILSIFKFRNEYFKQLDRKKQMKKVGHLSSFHVFFSELWPLNCLKKRIFCTFLLTSARNLGLLKQFRYMYLEGLITHFQKMVLFNMLWLTVLEILVFKIEEFIKNMLSQHLFWYFNRLYLLNGGSDSYKP